MLRWLRAHDPNWFGLKRAVRAAVVVPINFAIGSQLIGNAQVATFAAFGTFALLLFVNFSGGLATRVGGYAGLAVAGAVLIVLGTELAHPDWLAVLAMALIAFAVLYAGVISSMIGGASQAALLAFILAVMLPGQRSDLGHRLAGWGIAVALAVPVAILVWPSRDQDLLRTRTAALCRALADMLALRQPPPGQGDPLVAVWRAAQDLRTAFRTSATRTAGLSTGARLLIRLVDELEWLSTAVVNACADAPEQWPEQGRRLREAAAELLRASGAALDHDGTGPDPQCCLDFDNRLAALHAARDAVARESLADLRAGTEPPSGEQSSGEQSRGEFGRPLYAAHELGYAVALVGETVAAISAADTRSWWQRLLGSRVSADELGVITVAKRSVLGQFDWHSVWLQNSVRGAVGLAAAVLVSRVVDVQNTFWIGLGALSVLRSNALATGATVVRAIVGTAVGFAVGGALVAVLGTSHAVLWPLLPVLILLAALAPSLISFEAGQAAFTVVIIVLFNIIAPIGWRIGVVRIEDVALGCAASLGAGVLFWPRGAGAAFGRALGEAYDESAGYLRQAIEYASGRRAQPPDAGLRATAAGARLDDALRQYLAERGTKQVPLESVIALANGAARLRLAGTAIKRLRHDAPLPRIEDPVLEQPADLLVRRGDDIARWYETLAEAFEGPAHPLPVDGHVPGDESFLDVALPAVAACDDGQREQAERLLWSGQYLGDVDRLRSELLAPAAQTVAARTRPWWER